MSFDTYKEVTWKRELLQANQKALVYAHLTNGNVTINGNTAKINSVGTIETTTYVPGTDITVQTPDTSEQTFILDQKKYFAYSIEDIDTFQMVDSGAARVALMNEAGYAMANDVDEYLAGFYTDAGIKAGSNNGALGVVATPIVISSDGNGTTTKASQYLNRMSRRLNEGNVSQMGRKVVMPPWFMQFLIDEKVVSVIGVNNESVWATGQITKVYDFEIMVSNNVPVVSSTKYNIMAGVQSAFSLAKSLQKLEAYRLAGGFSDALKGLAVYGAKVIKATDLLWGVISEDV